MSTASIPSESIIALLGTPLEVWDTTVTTDSNDASTFVASVFGPGTVASGHLTSIGHSEPLNISFDYTTSGSLYSISIDAPGALQTLSPSGSFNLSLEPFETIDFTLTANGFTTMMPMPGPDPFGPPMFTLMPINANAILTLTNFSVTSAVPEPSEWALGLGFFAILGVVFFRRSKQRLA